MIDPRPRPHTGNFKTNITLNLHGKPNDDQTKQGDNIMAAFEVKHKMSLKLPTEESIYTSLYKD